MMWLDSSAHCGYKRRMEIAESYFQPLVTALRRAGKFDAVAYTAIEPDFGDTKSELDAKWLRWVEQESYIRLVYHVYEHDIYSTLTKVRCPLLSYAELSLPLPASAELWLAPSAEAWSEAFLGTVHGKYSSLSLRDCLGDHDLVRYLPGHIDQRLARSMYVYGLASQTWEYYQQSRLAAGPRSNPDPSTQLWLQTRHQSLYKALQDMHAVSGGCLAVTRLLHEFIMMSLHVDPDQVTRFAGKCGEEEAHRAYQFLQPWSQSKLARTAVLHAGQVLFAARAVPPYQLRGMDAFLIFHATVVCTRALIVRNASIRLIVRLT